METRLKRRRLISISSHVSSWPDLPARFESLNDDTLTTVLEFVGNKSYRSFGGLNYHCKEVYLSNGMTKETFVYGYASLSAIINKIERDGRFNQYFYKRVGKGVVLFNRRDVLEWVLQEQNAKLLKGICRIAAKEEKIDLLNEVWNHNVNENEDARRTIFGYVDRSAARGGKLEVLKWLETKRLPIDEYECVREAACHGQLHILQWLKEEKGLQLTGRLYNYAVHGGHLHVMKWFRENEVDWHDYIFKNAAQEGNLNVLQWLHNEGCPWPDDDYRAYEGDLKPEVIDWCRSNGYTDRLYGD